jgi:cytochrome P450
MASTAQQLAEEIRRRVPSLTALPLPRALDRRWLDHRWPVREFAPAPSGTALSPILGDAGTPLVGHLPEMMRFGPEYSRRLHRQYGPVCWQRAFGRRFVVLSGPDATQIALVNKDKAFSQEAWKFLMGKFFDGGVMLKDFEEHHLHRRILQQAFTRDRLSGYVGEFGPIVRDGVGAWSAKTESPLYWPLKHLTLDVATASFMGMPSGTDTARINRAFIDAVKGGTAIVRYPVPGGRWARGLKGRKLLQEHFAAALPAKRRGNGADLFSILCHATAEDGERFSDTEVINHMIFLMMAAHDTSTIAATATAYYLAKHPQWQERARAESLALGDEPPNLEALERLGTLDLVIKEALRLIAPIPLLARMTVRDTDVLGYRIPARTFIVVNPQPNHFDPECWTDPATFDPERFNDDRREDKSHRYAWMPFGGGAHKCVGQYFGMLEVKTVLHEMLRHYRWSVPTNYTAHWHFGPEPVPVDGLPITLQRH